MSNPRIYVVVEHGVVREIIEPGYDLDGIEYPIDERFPPELVSTMVEVTDVDPRPDQNWTYENGVFSQPIPYQRTSEEILASNTASRDAFLTRAALAIAPLQDAVDLDEATSLEVALLKKWKQYRVALNRIQLQADFPEPVQWPVEPV